MEREPVRIVICHGSRRPAGHWENRTPRAPSGGSYAYAQTARPRIDVGVEGGFGLALRSASQKPTVYALVIAHRQVRRSFASLQDDNSSFISVVRVSQDR